MSSRADPLEMDFGSQTAAHEFVNHDPHGPGAGAGEVDHFTGLRHRRASRPRRHCLPARKMHELLFRNAQVHSACRLSRDRAPWHVCRRPPRGCNTLASIRELVSGTPNAMRCLPFQAHGAGRCARLHAAPPSCAPRGVPPGSTGRAISSLSGCRAVASSNSPGST